MVELWLLAHRSDFPAFNDTLFYQFMFNQTNQWLKHKLVSMEDITLTKALTMASAAEQSLHEG